MTIVNRSAAPGAVIPTLVYDDVQKAARWLVRAFGFAEVFRYGPEGNPAALLLAAGDGSFFVKASRSGQSPGWTDVAEFRPPRPREVTQFVTVRVQAIDDHYERARNAGARIVHPPETYPFGERQYTAEDPEGHRWGFTESVADVTPQEWREDD